MDCRGGDVGAAGGWAWGGGLRALRRRGALDAPYWDGTALRFPRYGLTHPLAAAQAGGIAPRRWLPGHCGQAAPSSCPPSSLWVSALGAGCAGLPVCTRVRGPSEGRTQFWRGVCADVGHARPCRHGFACVAAAYVSACWGARASQRQRTEHGDTRKPAGSGAAAAPKPGWRRAPGTTVMGGAGRGKRWWRRILRPFPLQWSLGCARFCRAQSLSGGRCEDAGGVLIQPSRGGQMPGPSPAGSLSSSWSFPTPNVLGLPESS